MVSPCQVQLTLVQFIATRVTTINIVKITRRFTCCIHSSRGSSVINDWCIWMVISRNMSYILEVDQPITVYQNNRSKSIITMMPRKWMMSQSLVTRMFVQKLVLANNKENVNILHYWSIWADNWWPWIPAPVWYKTKIGSQNFGYQLWCLFCNICNVFKNMFNMSLIIIW